MAVQLAVATRNQRLDAIETEIGTSPILKIAPAPSRRTAPQRIQGPCWPR